MSKICCRCKRCLPYSEFHKSNKTKDGYKYQCKFCRSEVYIENRDKEVAKRKEHYKKTALQYKLRSKKWKKENPEKLKVSRRKYWNDRVGLANHYAAQRRARVRRANTICNDFFITEIYDLAKRRNAITTCNWHVDHIVPIHYKNASGLHNEFNLQVIPARLNIDKSNHSMRQYLWSEYFAADAK